ncbi:MAG: helix-turn-helix domain-containing protein [Anaerolineae bacterium]|nr:helix-turn-helix domain-containing protein [Anaerolineae bacterium]
MPSAKQDRAETGDWRETRRRRAWELYQQGCSQQEIAKALGVTQGAVSQWVKRARETGVDGLRHQPAPGRRTAMNSEQLAQIPALLAKGPDAYGIQSKQWTLAHVAVLLAQVFDVSYHPAHVSRLLRKHCPGWRDILTK